MKLIYSFIFLIGLIALSPQNQNFTERANWSEEDKYADSTLKEWKKFKQFETELENSELSKEIKGTSLKNYTRDSLEILTVKLMAVKILDEKELLVRDIAENTIYYQTFLSELKESTIIPTHYLFFERKLNSFVNQNLEQKVQQSNWMIYGLVFLLLLFILVLFSNWKTRKVILPRLSKQEKTIQNLILQGKSNKEIASELFISLSTVKSHITSIYSKLKVSNRQELLQMGTGAST